jgi:DNA replicative helicase MCM subunit Mcm2 (Cdc46/Mcm family)
MSKKSKTTLKIDFNHVQEYNEDLASVIRSQYYRFESFLRKSVQKIISEFFKSNLYEEDTKQEFWISFCNLLEVIKYFFT